jgi:hypothetical protein
MHSEVEIVDSLADNRSGVVMCHATTTSRAQNISINLA